MKPYYQDDWATIYHGDCREILPVECDAVITDPPYNIGKAHWDKIPDYLEWCASWIAAASEGCKQQGAFWCFHSDPLVLGDIARIIQSHGKTLQNWVTWDKYNETGDHRLKGFLDGFTLVGGLRRFQDFAEYAVYHADDGQWTAQTDKCRGFIFEPLRKYLDEERKRAGVDKADCNVACGFSHSAGGMASRHYFSASQWCLPTVEHYGALQRLFNASGGDYLRREYEDLRPTFNSPGKVSSVWQFPPAEANGHKTPKPVALMLRIIESTTNHGDVVLDPFTGSGTTGVACAMIGRRFIGIELEEKYCEIAANRLAQEVLDFT